MKRKSSEPPEAAAHAALLKISSSTKSTVATIILLRDMGDAFGISGFDVLADRLAGTGLRPGPEGVDDAAALKRIDQLEREGAGVSAVEIVARAMAPLDVNSQNSIAHRLRRKRKEKRTR